jgi:hypothetical protein
MTPAAVASTRRSKGISYEKIMRVPFSTALNQTGEQLELWHAK